MTPRETAARHYHTELVLASCCCCGEQPAAATAPFLAAAAAPECNKKLRVCANAGELHARDCVLSNPTTPSSVVLNDVTH